MKGLIIILTLLGLTMSLLVNGQSVNNQCEIIYDFVETMPHYKGDIKGLMDFVMTDLAPILSDCYKRDDILTASIYLTLTIDNQGKVIYVEFQRIQTTEQCKEELRKKLLSMTSWTPGKLGNTPVCCKYSWPISCINWK